MGVARNDLRAITLRAWARVGRGLVLTLAVWLAGPVRAQAAEAAPPAAGREVPAPDVVRVSPSVARRTLALGAAVVPGLALHGAGHAVMGDRATGLRLLAWEGLGVASMVAGVGGLALTGASSRTVALFIPMMIGGAGLFGTTWLSDVYGVAATPRVPGVPGRPPWIQAQAGLSYVHHRILDYGTFAVVGVDWRPGAFRMAPSAWLAMDGGNQRLRLEGAWRIVGPHARGRAGDGGVDGGVDGSCIELEAAITHHRYGTERFALTLGEVAVAARLDLARATPMLAGSFVEGALGVAAGGITYFGRTTDPTDLLLARFGWGVYWGRPAGSRWGEVAIAYDHRHDGYAGGMTLPGLGSGTLGSFGLRAAGFFWPRFGVALDGRVGSAYVVGASVSMRIEGTR